MADGITIPVDELRTLLNQINANSPDGSVTLTSDSDGRLIATWKLKDGTACGFGPTAVVARRDAPR